jgi:hypothetical protein
MRTAVGRLRQLRTADLLTGCYSPHNNFNRAKPDAHRRFKRDIQTEIVIATVLSS